MRWLLITILVFTLTLTAMACEEEEEGTATPTPAATEEASPEARITPEATPTRIPSPAAIPGSETPFTVDGFEVQISSVGLGESFKGFALPDMTDDEMVLGIEIRVLSGDSKSFGKLDTWVSDENGRETAIGAATRTTNKEVWVTWLFAVAKTSNTFLLHFPSGEAVDLSPLLP